MVEVGEGEGNMAERFPPSLRKLIDQNYFLNYGNFVNLHKENLYEEIPIYTFSRLFESMH